MRSLLWGIPRRRRGAPARGGGAARVPRPRLRAPRARCRGGRRGASSRRPRRSGSARGHPPLRVAARACRRRRRAARLAAASPRPSSSRSTASTSTARGKPRGRRARCSRRARPAGGLRSRASPPELWTDLATGASPAAHGVRALARVRPAGSPLGAAAAVRNVVAISARLGPRLGTRRERARSPARTAGGSDFWEVSASAGIPSLSVGWWAAAPWPGATVVENRAILSRARSGVEADRVAIGTLRGGRRERLRRRDGLPAGLRHRAGRSPSRSARRARRGSSALLEEWVAPRASAASACSSCSPPTATRGAPAALGRMVVFDGARRAALGADPSRGRRALDPGALGRSRGARSARARRCAALFAPGSARDRRRSRATARAIVPPPRRRRPRAIASTWRS